MTSQDATLIVQLAQHVRALASRPRDVAAEVAIRNKPKSGGGPLAGGDDALVSSGMADAVDDPFA